MESQRPRAWVRSPAHEKVIEILVDLRKRAGLTQRDLAAKLGTRQSLIARLEAGQRALTFLEFVAVCEALGTPPTAVLERVLTEIPQADRARAFPG